MYIDAEYSVLKRVPEEINKQKIYTYRVDLLDKLRKIETNRNISKISIEGASPRTKPREIYNISEKYDLCELVVSTTEEIIRYSQWKIDVIKPELCKTVVNFSKGSISSAVHAGIYFNIEMDGYFNEKCKKYWIYNVKEILRLCSKKKVIISFGDQILSEKEILEIFKKFNVKESISRKFYTENIENMLIQAATKRFAHKGAFIPIEENESDFKKMIYRATKSVSVRK